MPFTPSHAAAVLPLRRLHLPMAALVIGSMVPDLPYFLQLVRIDSGFTHTLAGVVSLDLALGLVCLVVWCGLLAPAAVRVAPDAVRARLQPVHGVPVPVSARRVAGSALALVIGALTHIVWDSFTHIGRFGPRHIDWLAQRHGALEGYRWAQYASGLVGAVVIATYLRPWWQSSPDDAQREPGPSLEESRAEMVPELAPWVRWSVLGLIGFGLLVGAGAGALIGVSGGEGVRHTVFLVATFSGGTAAAVALVAAIALRVSLLAR